MADDETDVTGLITEHRERLDSLTHALLEAKTLDTWEEPGGGGAVAAVQLARLAGECLFLTALGDDELGHRAERELTALGVRVEVAWRRMRTPNAR